MELSWDNFHRKLTNRILTNANQKRALDTRTLSHNALRAWWLPPNHKPHHNITGASQPAVYVNVITHTHQTTHRTRGSTSRGRVSRTDAGREHLCSLQSHRALLVVVNTEPCVVHVITRSVIEFRRVGIWLAGCGAGYVVNKR